MARPTFLYQRATDNVAGAALTLTGSAEDAEYPAAYLVDLNPAKPAKLTTTTGNWVWHFASPQQIDLPAIIHHNLSAGLDVRLQGNTANNWVAPALDVPFVIPAAREDGFPINPWLDLSELVPIDANRTFAWWRLTVEGTNSAAISIGEVWLGATVREFQRNISWGSTRRERRPVIEHETDMLVSLVYDLGVTQREIDFSQEPTDAGIADVLSWGRSCHWRAKPMVVIPNTAANDAYMMKFAQTEQEFVRERRNYNKLTVRLREMSAGLIP